MPAATAIKLGGWAALLVAVGGFVTTATMVSRNTGLDARAQLRIANDEYLAGHLELAGDIAQAASLPVEDVQTLPPDTVGTPEALANQIDSPPEETPEQIEARRWRSLRQFLIGAGLFEKGGGMVNLRRQSEVDRQAIEALSLSRELEFPPGRVRDGLRMIGLLQVRDGRHAEAIETLTEAIGDDPVPVPDLVLQLADCQAGVDPPRFSEAIETAERYLRLPRDDPDGHAAALYRLITWHRRAGNLIEAAAALKRAIERSGRWPEDVRRANQWRWVAEEAQLAAASVPRGQRLGEAVAKNWVERLDAAAASGPAGSRGPVGSAIASIKLAAGQREGALATYSRLRSLRPFTSINFDAILAELSLLTGSEADEVVLLIQFLAQELQQSDDVRINAQRTGQLAGTLDQAIGRLQRANEFESIVQVAPIYAELVDPAEGAIRLATAHRGWAVGLEKEREKISPTGENRPRRSELAADARRHHREAGLAGERAAKLRFETAAYPVLLWQAIVDLQAGKQFEQSQRLLEDYLRYEQPGLRPRGLIAAATAQLAADRPDLAAVPLRRMLDDYPRDPLRYDARFLLAQAQAESGDLAAAIETLRQNLRDGDLSPRSVAKRRALLAIGGRLIERARQLADPSPIEPATPAAERLGEAAEVIEQAIRRCEEAVVRLRDEPGPDFDEALYRLATAQKLAGRIAGDRLAAGQISEPVRRSLVAQTIAERTESRLTLSRLVEELLEKRRSGPSPIDPTTVPLLPVAMIRHADALAEENLDAEAAEAYRQIVLRFPDHPVALEAVMGQSWAVRRAGETEQADLLTRQAAAILARLPSSADGSLSRWTRYDRPGWETYLQSIRSDADPLLANSP